MIGSTVPLLSPILQSYGIDLVWFGVLLVVLIELGQITPPMGLNLFVVKSVSSSSLGTIIKGSLPFCAMIYVLILVLAVFPAIEIGRASCRERVCQYV